MDILSHIRSNPKCVQAILQQSKVSRPLVSEPIEVKCWKADYLVSRYVYEMYRSGVLPFPLETLSESECNQCQTFTTQVLPTLMKYRKQECEGAIEAQTCLGKMGELVAAKTMAKHMDIIGPDFTIYKGGQKSWDADLFSGDMVKQYAVKTCVPHLHEPSWTFQCGSDRQDKKFFTQPINPNLFAVFVVFDVSLKTGRVFSVVPATHTVQHFESPIDIALRDEKRIIYYETLIKNGLILGI